MRILYALILLIGCCALALPNLASAQAGGFSRLTDAATADTGDDGGLAAAIERAADAGVSVIVIDGSGNVLSQGQPGTPVDTAAAAAMAEGSNVMKVQDAAVEFRAALIERFLALPAAINEVMFILRAASPDGTLTAYGMVLFYSLLLFGVGMLFEHYVYGLWLLRPIMMSQISQNPQGYAEKMPYLVKRFVVSVGGIFVSIAVAYVIGTALFGALEDTALQFTATLINLGYFVCRFIAVLWRMILSPYLCQYRIPAFEDRAALRLYRWLVVLGSVDISTVLFVAWIRELGLNYEVYSFLAGVFSGVLVLLNVVMVLVNRVAISRAIRRGGTPEQTSTLLRIVSRLWAPIVIVYFFAAWGTLTYDLLLGTPSPVPLLAGAYGILVSIVVVYGGINFAIERGFARARAVRRMNEIMAEEEAQERALAEAEASHVDADEVARLEDALEETRAAEDEARAAIGPQHPLNTYEALARRVAGIIASVAGVYAFFAVWEGDNTDMVESVFDRLWDVIGTVFIGYIVYHVFRIWIDNKIREESGDPDETAEPGDEGSAASSATRLATLLPLFRNLVLITVVVAILLIVLTEMGVNVGPLFAGAGIVGVAIGFGSQALVRDIFAGAFFLFDDAFRKGEYLDVGGVKGTVEKISVRSFQLRHHLGALHTIPFGELQVMTNYSRDWVIMKLPLRVTYDTDVEKVRKLIKKLGQQLLDDPVVGPDFIQPLKSQGVIEMQDSAMIIRVKFMTKPGDQWMVRKKVYEEIRALFEREGIKFAHREVTVRLADEPAKPLTESQRNAVQAAAREVIEEEEMAGNEERGDDR